MHILSRTSAVRRQGLTRNQPSNAPAASQQDVARCREPESRVAVRALTARNPTRTRRTQTKGAYGLSNSYDTDAPGCRGVEPVPLPRRLRHAHAHERCTRLDAAPDAPRYEHSRPPTDRHPLSSASFLAETISPQLACPGGESVCLAECPRPNRATDTFLPAWCPRRAGQFRQ